MTQPLLHLDNVHVHFPIHKAIVKAVDGVSLEVRQGEILGIVGESGCGKSTLARAIVQLTPLTSGAIDFEGTDISKLGKRALREMRPRLQMIFQDPYASLNPRMTVYDTLAEPLRVHRIVARNAVAARVAELMEQVGLAPRFTRKYPHEFSGGQRQRIAIARALALKPKLIIADEPVSALDVSVQAQVLNLLGELRRHHDLTLILISHDLAVVRHISDRIAVMYSGKIVEAGESEDVFQNPQHPYTQTLLKSIPGRHSIK